MELINIISDYILYGIILLILVLAVYKIAPGFLKKSKRVEKQNNFDVIEYKRLLRARNSELQKKLAIDRIASERASGYNTSQKDLNISKIFFTRRSMVQQPARYQIINNTHELEPQINH